MAYLLELGFPHFVLWVQFDIDLKEPLDDIQDGFLLCSWAFGMNLECIRHGKRFTRLIDVWNLNRHSNIL